MDAILDIQRQLQESYRARRRRLAGLMLLAVGVWVGGVALVVVLT